MFLSSVKVEEIEEEMEVSHQELAKERERAAELEVTVNLDIYCTFNS